MTNKQLVDTLIACGKLDIDSLRTFDDCDVNLKDCIDKVIKLFKVADENKIAYAYMLLSTVLVKSENIKNSRKYMDSFLDFLKLYIDTFKLTKAADLIYLLGNSNISLVDKYNGWKRCLLNSNDIIHIDNKDVIIELKYNNSNDGHDSNLVCFDIDDNKAIACIFIRESKIEYIKVDNFKDLAKVYKRIIKEPDSYDLVLTPSLGTYASGLKVEYLKLGVKDNAEYLDLISYIEYIGADQDDFDIDSYIYIKNNRLNFIYFIESLGDYKCNLLFNTILQFGKISGEYCKDDEHLLNDIADTIEFISKHIEFNDNYYFELGGFLRDIIIEVQEDMSKFDLDCIREIDAYKISSINLDLDEKYKIEDNGKTLLKIEETEDGIIESSITDVVMFINEEDSFILVPDEEEAIKEFKNKEGNDYILQINMRDNMWIFRKMGYNIEELK